jgi:hypothetical protein
VWGKQPDQTKLLEQGDDRDSFHSIEHEKDPKVREVEENEERAVRHGQSFQALSHL